MNFVKMHGLGNDYVYVDCFHEAAPEDPAALARKVSPFHFGIGSDGLILILPCEGADARMRIFNADGSEAEMCGNGIRCVGKYLYDSGICKKDVLRIETGAGLKTLQLTLENGVCTGARVDMGVPCFEPAAIPVKAESNLVCLSRNYGYANFFCLSMGNPHAVTADVFPEGEKFYELGKRFENDPTFPKRANIGFIQRLSHDRIRARIWERGSGATLACGTGATACAVAANKMGLCGNRVYVELPLGELLIEIDPESGHVFMTGPATLAFTGSIDI